MKHHFLAGLGALVCLLASASANDSCAVPTTVVGIGPFPFDLSASTTGVEGQTEPICTYFGSSSIQRDQWFTWVAPFDGLVTVDLCGLTTVDTRLAVYEGAACPTTPALTCNDDWCGLQSRVEFRARAGLSYVVQLGTYPGAAGGTGQFQLVLASSPLVLGTRVHPVSGHEYKLLSPSGVHAAEAYARELGGHLVTVDDQAEHDWLTANFHVWNGSTRNYWVGANDVAVEGAWAWTDGTAPGFVAWDAGQPDNYGGGEDYAHSRSSSATGLWNDIDALPPITVHGLVEIVPATGLVFCAGDGSGTPCPCGNDAAAGTQGGCLNSLGVAARLEAVGQASLTSDTVQLRGSNMPNGNALYFQGTTQQSAGLGAPFGDGLRCAGGTIVRLGTKLNAAGASTYPGSGDASVSVRGLIVAPGTRTYQVWYRNAAAYCTASTFNLTNGLQVVWQ